MRWGGRGWGGQHSESAMDLAKRTTSQGLPGGAPAVLRTRQEIEQALSDLVAGVADLPESVPAHQVRRLAAREMAAVLDRLRACGVAAVGGAGEPSVELVGDEIARLPLRRVAAAALRALDHIAWTESLERGDR